MVTQINPTGGTPIPSATSAPVAIAARQPVSIRAASAPLPQAGSETVAVAQVNQHLQKSQTDLKLQVDAASGRTVFQVVQQGTGTVVLQVPSVEVLGMSRRIRDMAGSDTSGALVDKKS